LEGTVGKMSWWMECEVGNKQRWVSGLCLSRGREGDRPPHPQLYTLPGSRGTTWGGQNHFVTVTLKNLVSPRTGEENESHIPINICQLMERFGWSRSQGMYPPGPGFLPAGLGRNLDVVKYRSGRREMGEGGSVFIWWLCNSGALTSASRNKSFILSSTH
jgi:hypothetical protein